MKSHVLHTVWCNISGEAAGEIWYWSLLGVKGLSHCPSLLSARLHRCVEPALPVFPGRHVSHCLGMQRVPELLESATNPVGRIGHGTPQAFQSRHGLHGGRWTTSYCGGLPHVVLAGIWPFCSYTVTEGVYQTTSQLLLCYWSHPPTFTWCFCRYPCLCAFPVLCPSFCLLACLAAWLAPCLPICLPVSLSFCLLSTCCLPVICPPFLWPSRLSACLSFCLPACLPCSFCLSVRPPARLSCLSARPSVLSVCLSSSFASLSVRPSCCLPACLIGPSACLTVFLIVSVIVYL